MNLTKFLIWMTLFCSVFASLAPQYRAKSSDNISLHWTMSTPFPQPRTDYAAGALAGKLVIAGGTFWEGSKGHWTKKLFSASTHAFDPATQTWEELPDLPTPLACAASVVIGKKLYVLGGYTGTKPSRKIYTFAMESGKYAWTNLGTLPSDRLFAAAVTAGKQLFVLGGTTRFEPTDASGTCCTSKTATDSFMSLDTTHPEKGWRQLPSIPGPRRWLISAVSGRDSIWIFGGRFQENPLDPVINYNQVFRYDISNARWQETNSLPQGSPDAVPPSCVMVKGKILLITDYRKVWQLNPLNSLYTELEPLPEAAGVDRFIFLKGRIVGAGGENNLEGPRRRSAWTFIGRLDAN